MFIIISMAFVAFPDRTDALLGKSEDGKLVIQSSGSLGIFKGDSKCHPTFPNETLVADRKSDWCSNVGRQGDDKPWISYHFMDKMMKIKGYSIRNGCCDYYCCCDPQSGRDLDFACCCRLYSFSLIGSNDNITWQTIHQVVKETSFRFCEVKTYEFELSQPYKYVRFRMDQEKPGCPKCMQINQVELYGETVFSPFASSYEGDDENEESISIIGKVKRD